MAIKRRTKMTSTPVQFRDDQYENADIIQDKEMLNSFAEFVRKTVDFYIEKKYPNLVK